MTGMRPQDMTAVPDGAGDVQVVRSGQGSRLSVGSSTFLLGRASWTDGACNVLDQDVPPGLLVPPHVHAVEAQASYVLEGTVGFWVDGDEFELGAGGYILRPAGKPHALWNASGRPARMLEITTPAGRFEEYMQRISDLMDSGSATPTTVTELASAYGIEFVPDPVQYLCSKYGVDAAGGFWR
jgi:mannose-6-phosphate isomerase-like protein (cupin superfamily)